MLQTFNRNWLKYLQPWILIIASAIQVSFLFFSFSFFFFLFLSFFSFFFLQISFKKFFLSSLPFSLLSLPSLSLFKGECNIIAVFYRIFSFIIGKSESFSSYSYSNCFLSLSCYDWFFSLYISLYFFIFLFIFSFFFSFFLFSLFSLSLFPLPFLFLNKYQIKSNSISTRITIRNTNSKYTGLDRRSPFLWFNNYNSLSFWLGCSWR